MFVHPALLFLKIPMFASSNSLVIAKNPARVCPRIISPIIMFAIEVASILLRINLKEKLEKAIAFTPQTSSFRVSSFRKNKSPDPLLESTSTSSFIPSRKPSSLLVRQTQAPSSEVARAPAHMANFTFFWVRLSSSGVIQIEFPDNSKRNYGNLPVVSNHANLIGIPYTNGPPKSWHLTNMSNINLSWLVASLSL